MGTTTNYGWTKITASNKIDIVNDVNTPLDQIDASLKSVANTIPSAYTLPYATTSTLGGVKVGANVTTIDSTQLASEGTVNLDSGNVAYVPGATTSKAGAVRAGASLSGTMSKTTHGLLQVDPSTGWGGVGMAATSALGCVRGETNVSGDYPTTYGKMSVNQDTGIIRADPATTSQAGVVKPDGSTITVSNGTISAASSYTLPIASADTLGGVRVDATTTKINAAGGVLSSQVPFARFYTSSTSTMSKTANKLTLVEAASIGNIYSYSGGWYVSTGGYYYISATLGYTSATSGDSVHIMLYEGSSQAIESWGRNAGTSGCVHLNTIWYLTAGAYYYIYVQNATAARGAIDGGTDGSCNVAVIRLT